MRNALPRLAGTLVAGVLLALVATAAPASARIADGWEGCGVTAVPENATYVFYASITVTGTPCAEAQGVATHWYADQLAGTIPDEVFESMPFDDGGPFMFGAPYALDGYHCRYRKILSDVKEVWCVADDGRKLGWAAHRGLAGTPEDPHYPTQGPEELDPLPTLAASEANRLLRTALGRNFGGAFKYGDAVKLRCKVKTRTDSRCRPSWYIGDSAYSGSARIWYSGKGDDAQWNYSWTIRRVDTYCTYVNRKHSKRWLTRHCVKVFRVK